MPLKVTEIFWFLFEKSFTSDYVRMSDIVLGCRTIPFSNEVFFLHFKSFVKTNMLIKFGSI